MRSFGVFKKDDRIVLSSQTLCGKCHYDNLIDVTRLQKESDSLLRFIQFSEKSVKWERLGGKEISPSCSWMGGFWANSGYTKMNRNIIRGLLNRGMGLQLFSFFDDYIDLDPEEMDWFLSRVFCNSGKDKPLVVSSAFFPDKRREKSLFFTMSELESNPSDDFIKRCNESIELLVPTEWNKRKLLDWGVDNQIFVVPLGVDTSVFSKRDRDSVGFESGVNKYRFLCVASGCWRKGHDILLKSYLDEFSSSDDISLVILCHNYPVSMLEDKIKDRDQSSLPHIILSSSLPSDNLMASVYSSCDSFVLMSRGEGWGLPYCEAAACGLPIIGSDYGGCKAFLSSDNSFLVKPDKVIIAPESMTSNPHICKDSTFVDFSDTAIASIGKTMRCVFYGGDDVKIKAEKCRDYVCEKLSWDVSSEIVYNRLMNYQ